MCKPISIIMSADSHWTPDSSNWDHSHNSIRQLHDLPDGEWGDRFARVEVYPSDYRSDNDLILRDEVTNVVRTVDDTWDVNVDAQRAPDWWADDQPAQEDRARTIARRWLESCNQNLVPGHRAVCADTATITAGNLSLLAGGRNSHLEAGEQSAVSGYRGSTIKVGGGSTVAAHARSTITAAPFCFIAAECSSTIVADVQATIVAASYSRVTAGGDSIIVGKEGCILQGGHGSILCWAVYKNGRLRMFSFPVGPREGELTPDIAYAFNSDTCEPVLENPR